MAIRRGIQLAQLNVKLNETRLRGLRRYAERRRTMVSWLIRDYVDYLLAGGNPIVPGGDDVTTAEIAGLAERGGAFDWLKDEPDMYSDDDGEPV